MRGRHASGSNNERDDRASRNRSFVPAFACGLALCAGVDAGLAQSPASEVTAAADFDTPSVGKIGHMHDDLRRAAARRGLSADVADVYSDYLALKARMATEAGLAWSMDLSYLQQWGRPDGGSPAGQVLATPSLEWTLFDSAAIGTGSVQLAYNLTRYGTNRSAADLRSSLGLITPINDCPAPQNTFSQLTCTQALPNNKLLILVGQYPICNFDGNPYLGNRQQNFNSDTLAQNASATYAQAGLGAYIQVNATRSLQFVAGLQNASNVTGATLSTDGFGKYGSSWFGYAHGTPEFKGFGSAQYSFTYYQVPTVPAQPRSAG
jgi:porin